MRWRFFSTQNKIVYSMSVILSCNPVAVSAVLATWLRRCVLTRTDHPSTPSTLADARLPVSVMNARWLEVTECINEYSVLCPFIHSTFSKFMKIIYFLFPSLRICALPLSHSSTLCSLSLALSLFLSPPDAVAGSDTSSIQVCVRWANKGTSLLLK